MGWETQGQPLSLAVQGKNQVTHVPASCVPLAADPKAVPVPSWHGAHSCEVTAGSLCMGPISYFLPEMPRSSVFYISPDKSTNPICQPMDISDAASPLRLRGVKGLGQIFLRVELKSMTSPALPSG